MHLPPLNRLPFCCVTLGEPLFCLASQTVVSAVLRAATGQRPTIRCLRFSRFRPLPRLARQPHTSSVSPEAVYHRLGPISLSLLTAAVNRATAGRTTSPWKAAAQNGAGGSMQGTDLQPESRAKNAAVTLSHRLALR
jgi:hypothetical protein